MSFVVLGSSAIGILPGPVDGTYLQLTLAPVEAAT